MPSLRTSIPLGRTPTCRPTPRMASRTASYRSPRASTRECSRSARSGPGNAHHEQPASIGVAVRPARSRADVDRVSAIEDEPAELVAQPLVVKHEVPDLRRELSALPLALQ